VMAFMTAPLQATQGVMSSCLSDPQSLGKGVPYHRTCNSILSDRRGEALMS
jgi:hypothetical protein